MASPKRIFGDLLSFFSRGGRVEKRPQGVRKPQQASALSGTSPGNGLLGLPLPDQANVWSHDKNTGRRPFYFVHIPKTAGTSLIAILDRLFHQQRIFPAQLWRELTLELTQRSGDYAFFRGHFGGGGLKVFADQPPRLLTLLRDPLSLSVSTYHFVQREEDTRVHRLVRDEGMSLRQFATDPRTRHLIENRQVRYLSFDIHDDPDAQDIFLSERSEQVVRQWLPEKVPQLTEEQRHRRALALLQQCDWFGLQERFDDSVRLLAWQFGLPPLGASERLNVNQHSRHDAETETSAAAGRAILARNRWDKRLYRWAQEEFERRFQRMQQSLEAWRQDDAETLDDLLRRAWQARAREKLGALPPDQLANESRFDFAWPMLGSHWHRRELALPEKQWFRWSGPALCADIWLVRQPGEYALSLEIINALSPGDIHKLQLAVNQVKLPISLSGDPDSVVRQVTAQVPACVFSGSPLLRLQLRVPRSLAHADAFGSDDRRRVGVAVRSLSLRPLSAE